MSDQAPQQLPGDPRSDVMRVADRQAAYAAAGLDPYGRPVASTSRLARAATVHHVAPPPADGLLQVKPEPFGVRLFWSALKALRAILILGFVCVVFVPASREMLITAWVWVFGVATLGLGPLVLLAKVSVFGIESVSPRYRRRR
ncbi:hypothetical protein QEZ54_11465 [Catellatospora sp. KI3]|uniref:hypothetical protein n=1 Tax=Catellatospora sp. KI3 TaxID=3041620 RepID=UPI002482307D|nr:hypothetical protein [Catellatospora sp. KI3]MDI1461592.1 hypothetical protein [Catellatospora sp. KI3]